MTSRILLVEDEPDVCVVIRDMLCASGYEVQTGSDGKEGLRAALAQPFDLLILDVMLPGMDGFQICHSVRERGFDGAILMLTARSQVDDRVQGLQTGADDYLVKPFDPKELLARVVALLRRIHKSQLTPVAQFSFGDVEVDFLQGKVTKAGERLNLAAKELQVLRYLVDHRGQVITREQLLSRVWARQPFITPRTVDVHIAWLRQKLEQDPQNPRFIRTVRGEGYCFDRPS